MKRATAAVLVLLFGGGAAAAAAERRSSSTGRPEVTALRLEKTQAARAADGVTDAIWESAPRIADFVQREPHDGAAATFRTEARIAYDSDALYVNVRAWDPEPQKIVGILTRRDTGSPSDWIALIIDSYHDHRTGYEFDVNPAGVKTDKYWYSDNGQDDSWDAVWDVKVATDAQGWTARFRIPFSQLRFKPQPAGTFGVLIGRRIGRLNELDTWPALPKSASAVIASFADLTGLSLDRSAKRFEVVPYAVGQVTTERPEAGDPFTSRVDPGSAFGADVKFALTPGLTITATVNPDFGQVEADPAVVNLTGFETFFAERRPFFVEGSGNFRFDIDCNDGECRGLFYSRRIGRAPHFSPDAPEGGFVRQPALTRILGAAKLTGRVGSFSIGALNAVTGREEATIASGEIRTRTLVEPFTSYSVGRMRREFRNQSSIGFMFTSVNRRLASPDVRELTSNASTGGTDWDWRFRSGTYHVTGYWAGSVVRGDPAAIDEIQTSTVHGFQRPDAGHVREDPARRSLAGHAANVDFGKIGGNHVHFDSVLGYKTPGFEINDLGFLTRADEIFQANWVQWRDEKPSKHLNAYSINFNQWSMWNFDGDRRALGGNVNAHVVTRGQHRISAGYNIEGRGFDDRLSRGGPGGYSNPSRSAWHAFNTDDRRAVQYTHTAQMAADDHGSRVVSFAPAIRFRPTAAFSISSGVSWTSNDDQSQWVEKVTGSGDHYVFARLKQTTVGIQVRVSYTVKPSLSIQMYAQPFVSAGDYSQFKELVNGRAARYEDRYRPFAYADNPDFNYRSFRTTNVVRWEYKPGSTLFVVWQQGRENELERGDFAFRRDFRQIFATPARNVFLVKMAHWLNF